MEKVTLRKVTPQERCLFEEIAIRYFRELDEGFSPTQNWYEGFFRAATQGEGASTYWAITSNEIVGFITVRVASHRYKPIQVGYVEEMYVLPHFRNKGIGEELARKAISLLRSLGVSRIDLSVLESNEPAKRFWSKLGFRKIAENYRLNLE